MAKELKKKFLITGGKGFLGSAVVKRLLALGYELRLLIRPGSEKTSFYDYLQKNCHGNFFNERVFYNLEIYEGDITAPFLGLGQDAYNRLADETDEVLHCAAATHFESSRAAELKAVNVHGTENMLRFAASGRTKRFHYISTAYVAGRQNGTVYEEGDLVNVPVFNNEYEKTKFFAEKWVIEYSRNNAIPYTIYRPSIIVGDSRTGFTCKYDNIYTFAKAMSNLRNGHLTGEMSRRYRRDGTLPGEVLESAAPVRVPGDPDAFVNLVPVDYVADAIIEILSKRETIGKIFHIVNPDPPTISELRDLLISILEIKGIRLIIDGKMDGKRLRSQERLFLRQTRTYYSYLFNKLRFDSTNTRVALQDTNIQCPAISHDIVKILMEYALFHDWGGRKNTSGKEPVPCERLLSDCKDYVSG
ncbi:MAG: SDR family oxidoreductase [Candidatus Scalindua sp.]|nr:SDR family oxidoreductase [Candidatus Scalindua sp.]